jgi:DNA-binding response OmpR family regulator
LTADTVARAREQLFATHIDLVLLDISLPDGDGFLLCTEIKEKNLAPVIFLTAKEEERDVVKGFDLGADDYVVKPFRNRELISRIRNVLRRNGKEGSLFCGNVRLDVEAGKVFCGETEVGLTKLEYRICYILFSNPTRLFTREELLDAVWDSAGNFVNDNTLTVTMKRLREKIGDKEGKIIQTVRGMGYRLG